VNGYEKGKFVVIKDEDFARVDVEATSNCQYYQLRCSGRYKSAPFPASHTTSRSEKAVIKRKCCFETL